MSESAPEVKPSGAFLCLTVAAPGRTVADGADVDEASGDAACDGQEILERI